MNWELALDIYCGICLVKDKEVNTGEFLAWYMLGVKLQ